MQPIRNNRPHLYLIYSCTPNRVQTEKLIPQNLFLNFLILSLISTIKQKATFHSHCFSNIFFFDQLYIDRISVDEMLRRRTL